MGMRRILAALALGTAALAAQAGGVEVDTGNGVATLRVTSLKAARFQATLHQQYDFSCGSAALATLLTFHYGLPTTEEDAFRAMFRDGDAQKIRAEGFSLLDMKRYLAARGFVADGFELPLDTLAQAGVPAVVLIAENGYHHFVVVKGVQADRVLVGDPSRGTRSMPRARFEAQWENRLLFVIHQAPAGAARFNAVADWRVAPRAPLAEGVARDAMASALLARIQPGAL